MELKTFFVQNSQGNAVSSPVAYVYSPGTTNLVSGLKDVKVLISPTRLLDQLMVTLNLVIKVKGSDGVVRSTSLTLV